MDPAQDDDPVDTTLTVRHIHQGVQGRGADRKCPFLLVLRGPDMGLRVPLDETEITLGRTNDARIVLHDTQISRRHIAVRREDDGGAYRLVDQGSTNGTWLNGELVKESPLRSGDRIFIGSTILKFVIEDEVEFAHGSKVHEMAFRDDLTGLIAKHRFYEELAYVVEEMARRSKQLVLVMMDLDGLKQVNDAHGHATGASIIATAGRLIGEIMNPLGQASRFGGDEFVAYLRDHDRNAGRDVCERVRAAIEQHRFEKDGTRLRVTISIGFASLTGEARTGDALSKAADEALYRAKAKGRNCVSD